MLKPGFPKDELERLQSLYSQKLLDTSPEPAFNEIVSIASVLCQTQIALISLVDKDRQWFKAAYNLDASETAREISFCAHAILGEDIFEVPDAREDERFCDNPLVQGEPNIRFYAGIPIHSVDNHKIGTLCVIDDQPQKLTQEQLDSLRLLGKHVENLMRFRTSLAADTEAKKKS